MTSETKICQNCKASFTIDASDFAFYEKMKVPAPTWCPECRMVRRMMFRNERVLWKDKNARTGQEIFSMFPPGRFKIYDKEYWWSDKWDAREYGRDYNFSVPFFTQLQQLMQDVPWFNLSMENPVNSDFSNNAIDIKDCYLSFDVGYSERLYYCTGTENSRDSFDLTACKSCEQSAHNFYCTKCYKVFYSVSCEECQNVWFSKDCVGCSDCFGCVNLKNKQYYIFNEPYIKEAYEAELKKFELGSEGTRVSILNRVEKLWLEYPVKYMHGRLNKNASGDYLYNSKNVYESFWANNSEDSKYIQSCSFGPTKDCCDMTLSGISAELCYEGSCVGVQTAGIKFGWLMYTQCLQSDYCMNCHHVSNCFGCIGIQNKQYCILNKQYTKEEYEALVPKIIRHMEDMPYEDKKGRAYKYGEFFPPEFSPYAYNRTLAHEYFPLTKEGALARGYGWDDTEKASHQISINTQNLPETAQETPNTITQETIQCAHNATCLHQCTAVFRVLQPEFEFYKKNALSFPQLCPNCRHGERVQKYRNPFKLWRRNCMCAGVMSEMRAGRVTNDIPQSYHNTSIHFHKDDHCPNEFETAYSPDRPEIVYCEQCYQAEVV